MGKEQIIADFFAERYKANTELGGKENIHSYLVKKYSKKKMQVKFPGGNFIANLFFVIFFIAASATLITYKYEEIIFQNRTYTPTAPAIQINDKSIHLFNESFKLYQKCFKKIGCYITLRDAETHPEIMKNPSTMVYDICSNLMGKDSLFGIPYNFSFTPIPNEPSKTYCIVKNQQELDDAQYLRFMPLFILIVLDLIGIIGYVFFRFFRV